MDTRFIAPATAAALLHTFVLFGVTWPHMPIPGVRPSPPTASQPHVVLEVPLVNDPPATDLRSSSASKGPTEAPPTLPDPVVDRPDSIPIAPTPESNRPRSPIDAVLFAPPGNPFSEVGCGCGDPVFTSAGLDHPPKTRFQSAPVYPDELKRSGVEGEVLVDFLVDEQGRVHDPRVVHASDPGFEASTLRAVSNWRFEPGERNNHPVRFRMQIPINFKLER